MTKDSSCNKNWESNYSNKLLSGIEIRNNKGKLVNFIIIKHDEILDNKQSHRISINLNENSEPLLPEPQTFEQMIQAKRRQQNILFAQSKDSHHHRIQHHSSTKTNRPTTSSVLTSANNRTIRRTATRRSVTNAISRARKTLKNKRIASSVVSGQVLVGKKRKIPKSTLNTFANQKPSTSSGTIATLSTTNPSTSAGSMNKIKKGKIEKKSKELKASSKNGSLSATSTAGQSTSSGIVSSKKIAETEMDPKELKLILKATPPGATVVLPSGLVIRKSRRGGARAGAGRKRSRPLPENKQQQNNNSNYNQESMNFSESGNDSLTDIERQTPMQINS